MEYSGEMVELADAISRLPAGIRIHAVTADSLLRSSRHAALAMHAMHFYQTKAIRLKAWILLLACLAASELHGIQC